METGLAGSYGVQRSAGWYRLCGNLGSLSLLWRVPRQPRLLVIEGAMLGGTQCRGRFVARWRRRQVVRWKIISILLGIGLC